MKRCFRGLWLCSVLAAGLGFQQKAEAGRLKIVASFLPAYCFAANVVGDLATVENLLPASVDPHDYQLAPRDLARLTAADVVIVNGLSLEGWLDRAIQSAGGRHFPMIIQLADGLDTNELIYDADAPWTQHTEHQLAAEKRFANPHIWLDPQLAQHAVTNISRGLQKADPANAAGYARNAAAYVVRLQRLDGEIRTMAAALTHRDLVTYHNAFPYLARRCGLNVVGVVEEVDEVPPSPKHLARLEEALRAKGIKVLFTSPPLPPREARQIAADTGIAIATLNTIETGPLKPEIYEDGMRDNLKTLAAHLR